MLLIPCPYCGDRHESEFTYGGDASRSLPESDSIDAWHDAIYERDNMAGIMSELWHHSYGCGQWIILKRDTRTNRFVAAGDGEP